MFQVSCISIEKKKNTNKKLYFYIFPQHPGIFRHKTYQESNPQVNGEIMFGIYLIH